MTMTRIARRFKSLKEKDRGAFIAFITAGDPDYQASLDIMKGLPDAGADLIELGMPFSDPSADGPAIEKASGRALRAGADMHKTLDMVREFRRNNSETPVILMGYINPILAYDTALFMKEAASAGVDGLIIVDLPPEEDTEVRKLAESNAISIIRLVTPTTDSDRLATVLNGSSGFIYYVSVAGTTGQKSATADMVNEALTQIRAKTDLPLAVGFGIKTKEHVSEITAIADAAVVGSAIVSEIANNLDGDNRPGKNLVTNVLGFVKQLTSGIT